MYQPLIFSCFLIAAFPFFLTAVQFLKIMSSFAKAIFEFHYILLGGHTSHAGIVGKAVSIEFGNLSSFGVKCI